VNIQPDVIIARLVSEFDYSEKLAKEVARKLRDSAPEIQVAFEKWWYGGGFDEHLVVQGYTAQRLVEKYRFTPPNAFVTLDWLIREPEKAVKALARGYDRVVMSPERQTKYREISERFKRFEEEKEQGKN
jgi:hypothetical protein